MDPRIKNKTGNAPVKKTGHTVNGQFGNFTNSTTGRGDAKDLNIKTKGR